MERVDSRLRKFDSDMVVGGRGDRAGDSLQKSKDYASDSEGPHRRCLHRSRRYLQNFCQTYAHSLSVRIQQLNWDLYLAS